MNRQVHLRRYPQGVPQPGDFAAVDGPEPSPAYGELLVAVTHLSMDPFPRLRMRPDSPAGPPMPLGRTVEGRGVGRVLAGEAPGLAPGDWVAGELGWQQRVAMPAAALERLDPALGPLPLHLSALGPSGLAAWLAMVAVGQVAAGDRVVVAPAAGAVGSIAGQVAKAAGATVIGVASGAEQRAALATLGFEAALDHDGSDFAAALAAAAPAGVSLFLDGVGGPLTEQVIEALAPRGRVVLLGFISGYNADRPPAYGNLHPLLMKRARAEGFLLADHRARFPEARAALARLVAEGALVPLQRIHHGLDNAPHAFCSLFGAAPPGKQIVALED